MFRLDNSNSRKYPIPRSVRLELIKRELAIPREFETMDDNLKRAERKVGNLKFKMNDRMCSKKVRKVRHKARVDEINGFLSKLRKNVNLNTQEIELSGILQRDVLAPIIMALNDLLKDTTLAKNIEKFKLSPELNSSSTACVVIGIPGSGKTSCFKKIIHEPHFKKEFYENYITFDQDDVKYEVLKCITDELKSQVSPALFQIIKHHIENYTESRLNEDIHNIIYGLIHPTSVDFVMQNLDEYMKFKGNFVLHITGDYWPDVETIAKKVKAAQYTEFNIVFVKSEPSTSINRAIRRASDTWRDLPLNYLLAVSKNKDDAYRMNSQSTYINAENSYLRLKQEYILETSSILPEVRDIHTDMKFFYYYNGELIRKGQPPILIEYESLIK